MVRYCRAATAAARRRPSQVAALDSRAANAGGQVCDLRFARPCQHGPQAALWRGCNCDADLRSYRRLVALIAAAGTGQAPREKIGTDQIGGRFSSSRISAASLFLPPAPAAAAVRLQVKVDERKKD